MPDMNQQQGSPTDHKDQDQPTRGSPAPDTAEDSERDRGETERGGSAATNSSSRINEDESDGVSDR